jgi:hypothetical protein
MRCLRLNVYGREIPSKSSIQAILNNLPDKNSQEIFIEYSKNWRLHQEKIVYPDLYLDRNDPEEDKLQLLLDLNQIHEKQAALSGFLNFDFLMQSKSIAKWHESIRDNFTGGDGSKLMRRARYFHQVMGNERDYDPSKYSSLNDFTHLLEYRRSETGLEHSLAQEYSIALEFEHLFYESITIISKTNPEMSKLLEERCLVIKKMSEVAENETDTEYFYHCPFCKKCKLVKQGKTPRHCGLCETDYQNSRKKINRPPATPNEWVVAYEGNRRTCVDCGEKRQVNINTTCRKCFPQSFTQ